MRPLAVDLHLNGNGEYQFTHPMVYSQQTGGQCDFEFPKRGLSLSPYLSWIPCDINCSHAVTTSTPEKKRTSFILPKPNWLRLAAIPDRLALDPFYASPVDVAWRSPAARRSEGNGIN